MLFFGSSQKIKGQNSNQTSLNERTITLQKGVEYYALDSVAILPSSIVLDNPNDTLQQAFKFYDLGIQIRDTSILRRYHDQELSFSYRRFPNALTKTYRHLDKEELLTADKAIYIGYDYTPSDEANNPWDESGIDYDGSFARGFSIGNSQSLLLNSDFNMQMSGDIGDGIKIKAAISDDNIPIQPEGNTRLLQEFDKVFIQVSKDKSYITAGDYEVNKPNSYFINYFKQVQGLSAYHEAQITDNQYFKQKASFAVSRAIFNRFLIPVIEANQGPYKLPGANGERFIIIEAGSEKIYEDGRLLTRGQNHDYLINYDRAEITFTEKKLITKDSRITAEYEYVDRNYLRTMYATESTYDYKNLSLRFNFFSQQDSRNVTGDRPLDSIDLDILQLGGDDLDDTRRFGGRLLEDNSDLTLITYTLSADSILTFSVDQSQELYVAIFTETEAGQGSYIIDTQINANGRVYTYVGPGMGNYIPEIQLVAPQKNQIMALGATYKLSKNTNVETELSLSNNDLNRLSTLDSEDDIGTAAYVKLNHSFTLAKDSLTALTLTPFLAMEYTDRNFQAFNPYRAIEFTRDWNLPTSREKTDETILRTGLNISRAKQVDFNYSLSSFNRQNIYEGLLHRLDYKINYLGFELTSLSSLLTSEDNLEKTAFLRPILGISRTIGKENPWKTGYVYEAEKNDRLDLVSENLQINSLAFRVHQFYIQSPEKEKLKGRISYENRLDLGVDNGAYQDFSRANDLILNGTWNASKTSLLNVDFTYRDLQITDVPLAEAKNVQARRSYLGQADYQFSILDGFLKSTSSFNIGSGQQAKVEFDYQEVLPGEGNYDWIDINEDGVQQLAEFRLSEFQDTSRFIQIPLFNNEFIQTNNSGINQSLRVDFNKVIKNKSGQSSSSSANSATQIKTKKKWYSFMKIVSLLSTVRINKKVEIDDNDYNPLDFSFGDSTIVSFNALNNHTLYLNRGNPAWDMQFGYRANKTKFVQISGSESRGLAEYFSRYRMGLDSKLDFIIEGKIGQTTGDSEIQDARDFEIDFFSIQPELNYRPMGNLRFISRYEFQNKQQTISDLEMLTSHDFTLESTWRVAQKTNLNVGLSFIRVDFEGEENTFTAFELLQGLRAGNNFLWSTSYTRRLAKNVDLIINYEGRKTGDNSPIHTARAQVKATF